MSKGEEKIAQILIKAKVDFIREKTFSDLKKGKYRFDFYVEGAQPKKFAIEVNGAQHYTYTSKFYKSRSEFEAAKERDRRKISYCLAHRIPLFIIPYWELDNINCLDDILKEKFHARDRWKNDRDWAKHNKI